MRDALTRLLARLGRTQDGAVSILIAFSLTALLMSVAVAVDIGSVFLAKRHLQGAVDAAAMAAANALANPQPAALRALSDNNASSARITLLQAGVYTPNPALAAAARFTPGAAGANAVKVSLVQNVPVFFSQIFTGRSYVPVTVTSTSTRMDYAAFSIGTRLAAVQGGIANQILSALAGANLNLSLMDYNSLASANVDVLSFSKALGTQINATGLSYQQILSTQATLPQVLNALSAATSDPTAAAALRTAANEVPTTPVTMSKLINLGPYGAQDYISSNAAVTVQAYSILRETLALANGSRQVSFTLGVALPGVTSTTVTLAIGQRAANSPWISVADDGSTIIYTAQTRLYLDAAVGGAGTLGLATLRLPVYTELAQGEAKLTNISCSGGPANATVTLSVLPSVGHVAIADLSMSQFNDFSAPLTENPAMIATAPTISVTGNASVAFGGITWQSVPFSASDIANNVTKTVSTSDLAQGIVASLVKQMNLKVTVLGMVVPVSPLTATVGTALTPIAPELDTTLDTLEDLLGVHVGQADVQINGTRCGVPSLIG